MYNKNKALTFVLSSLHLFSSKLTSKSYLYLIPFASSVSAGGAVVPKPQIGSEEQPPLHPGLAARHLPAPAYHPVTLRRQNGDTRGQ